MFYYNVLFFFIYEEIIEVKEWTPYLGQDDHISLEDLKKINMNNQ